jgi:hypothetical protein
LSEFIAVCDATFGIFQIQLDDEPAQIVLHRISNRTAQEPWRNGVLLEARSPENEMYGTISVNYEN